MIFPISRRKVVASPFGEKNHIFLTHGCMDMISNEPDKRDLEPDSSYLAELYGADEVDLPDDAYPLKFSLIDEFQKQDKELLAKAKKNPAYTTKIFRGGGTSYDLIVKHSKIVIPKPLQERTIRWYHETLCHPGIARTESTI